jgi:hypothetical protein
MVVLQQAISAHKMRVHRKLFSKRLVANFPLGAHTTLQLQAMA